MKYMEVKRVNPYVRGVVGQDVRLSLPQRIMLLFHKGITVALISPEVAKESTQARKSK